MLTSILSTKWLKSFTWICFSSSGSLMLRAGAHQEPAVHPVALLHLELLVVLESEVVEVLLAGEEAVGAVGEGGLVVGHALLLPLVEALGDPPVEEPAQQDDQQNQLQDPD